MAIILDEPFATPRLLIDLRGLQVFQLSTFRYRIMLNGHEVERVRGFKLCFAVDGAWRLELDTYIDARPPKREEPETP